MQNTKSFASNIVDLRTALETLPSRSEVEAQLKADWPDMEARRIAAALDWLFKEDRKHETSKM